ncbi:MAG: hypothetical protein ACOYOV_16695, partial [Bacteroidales bacterium]
MENRLPRGKGRAFGNFALKNQTNGIYRGTGKRSRSHDGYYLIKRKIALFVTAWNAQGFHSFDFSKITVSAD